MPEEIITAETTETAVSGTDNNADVGQNNDGVNDAAFSDDSETVTTGNEDIKKAPAQNNSENARRRREAERQAELDKARKAARNQAIIDALDGKNPYSGEDIKDSADVEEYLIMKEIKKNGGDPIADYAKHVKTKEREIAAQKAKNDADAEWYRKDRENFAAKHPDINISELIKDEHFNKYANGKVGEMPLSDIYEGYIGMVEELRAKAEKNANKKAQQQLANAKASPGSLSSADTGDSGFYTREQVLKMNKKEIHENYDKIRASMSTPGIRLLSTKVNCCSGCSKLPPTLRVLVCV